MRARAQNNESKIENKQSMKCELEGQISYCYSNYVHCHMLCFHQVQFSDFTVISTYSAPLTYSRSTLHMSFILLSFKLCLSFYLSFYFVLHSFHQLRSVIFQPPPVLLFDHSLYLVYLFIILCLCM